MEHKGIGFFNVSSGDTHYAKSEAQIQAYINSSDMGINASRGQDFGWRLEPEWVDKVRQFRANETKMSILISKNDGRQPTTPQILHAIYGAELREQNRIKQEESKPFEEEYLQKISTKRQKKEVVTDTPKDTNKK
jgi:hypothetical protein